MVGTHMRKSKERGQSHSTRPPVIERPEWVNIPPERLEEIVINLYKKGYPLSVIGIILRDQYGVPLVRAVTGKKMLRILRERGMAPEIPEDLFNLIRRAVKIRRHLEEHPKDFHSKRGLQLVESKIYRLSKYYKRRGVLPREWKYEPEKIAIYV